MAVSGGVFGGVKKFLPKYKNHQNASSGKISFTTGGNKVKGTVRIKP